MKIQCATCYLEPTTISALQTVWTDYEEFSMNYMRYQDAARKNRCRDYMAAFAPRFKPLLSGNQ